VANKNQFQEGKIKYDNSIRCYIHRTNNKQNGDTVKVILEECLDEKNGLLIKDTHFAKLSIGSRNPKRDKFEIISFNNPDEKIGYKALMKEDTKEISKLFVSVEEGKWESLKNPSTEIVSELYRIRAVLKNTISPSKSESAVIFIDK